MNIKIFRVNFNCNPIVVDHIPIQYYFRYPFIHLCCKIGAILIKNQHQFIMKIQRFLLSLFLISGLNLAWANPPTIVVAANMKPAMEDIYQ
ncbi:MAG: hypothetical protein RLY99_1300, partial [Pseudomonadota bacterium]